MSAPKEARNYLVLALPTNPLILGDLLRGCRDRRKRGRKPYRASGHRGNYRGARDDLE